MSKLTRAYQRIFGTNATLGVGGIEQFGSLAAGSINYTNDPALLQSLSQFLDGWEAAILGNNSPAIEDMNALFYLAFRQIAYGLQEGIAEWNVETPYYINSYAKGSNGLTYVSKTDDNIGNDPTVDAINWKSFGAGKQQIIVYGATLHGSTNTCIRIFNNVQASDGTDITRSSDSVNGDSYTINASGIYSMSYEDLPGSNGSHGFSVNSTQLSTAIQNINEADRVMFTGGATSIPSAVSTTTFLNAGDVIRPHDDGLSQVTAVGKFTIVRVA